MSQETRTLRATARSGSFDGVKRVKSLFSKTKKPSSDQGDHLESPRSISGLGTERKSIRSEIGKMGPICKARKKVMELVEQDQEIDLDDQIGKERSSTECMWLSSDNSSPSYFFEEYRLSTSLHLSVDKWLISWLSTLANSYIHLDKASSAPNKASVKNPEEDLKEERRFSLISKSGRSKIDFSVSSSESSTSYFEHCCGNFTSSDNSVTPRSTTFDSPSCSPRTSDLDRMSFSVSLLSLDGDDSKWISDTELLESDILQSSFRSPSCWRSWSSEAFSSSSNVSTTSEFEDRYLQHDLSLKNSSLEPEDLNADGPLFWPCDKKLDWNPDEVWKCFAMSPRKDTMEQSISTSGRFSSKSAGKMDSKVGCRRRLVFSSGSAASDILEKKRRKDNSSTKKITSMHSRLKNSVKGGKVSTPEVDSESRNFLKDNFGSKEGHPIETLMGLGEFDGHEGVDSEFNQDFFSLDDSF